MNNADQLIAGYSVYTDAADFGVSAVSQAPATTPSILSVIATSTAACGAAVSATVTVSVTATAHAGC